MLLKRLKPLASNDAEDVFCTRVVNEMPVRRYWESRVDVEALLSPLTANNRAARGRLGEASGRPRQSLVLRPSLVFTAGQHPDTFTPRPRPRFLLLLLSSSTTTKTSPLPALLHMNNAGGGFSVVATNIPSCFIHGNVRPAPHRQHPPTANTSVGVLGPSIPADEGHSRFIIEVKRRR